MGLLTLRLKKIPSPNGPRGELEFGDQFEPRRWPARQLSHRMSGFRSWRAPARHWKADVHPLRYLR